MEIKKNFEFDITSSDTEDFKLSKEDHSIEVVCENEDCSNRVLSDSASHDLMIMIGEAIDKWARIYGLESVPKNILFQQTLSIMKAWNSFFQEVNK